jgi:hypothetical protein
MPETSVADEAPGPTETPHASQHTTTSGSNDHSSDREIAEFQQAVENSLHTYHQEQANRSRHPVSQFPLPVRPWEQPPIQRNERLHKAKRLVKDFAKGAKEIIVSIRNNVKTFLVSLKKNTDRYARTPPAHNNGATVNGDPSIGKNHRQ